MSTQYYYWLGAGAALAVAIVAAVAEQRRQHRRDLDAIGWVPWRGIQVAAAFALIAALILAVRAG